MVRKVAGEDGGEVKHLARFAVQFIHTVGNRMSKGCQLRKCLRVVRLDEERNLAIVQRAAVAERLHRIEHTAIWEPIGEE